MIEVVSELFKSLAHLLNESVVLSQVRLQLSVRVLFLRSTLLDVMLQLFDARHQELAVLLNSPLSCASQNVDCAIPGSRIALIVLNFDLVKQLAPFWGVQVHLILGDLFSHLVMLDLDLLGSVIAHVGSRARILSFILSIFGLLLELFIVLVDHDGVLAHDFEVRDSAIVALLFSFFSEDFGHDTDEHVHQQDHEDQRRYDEQYVDKGQVHRLNVQGVALWALCIVSVKGELAQTELMHGLEAVQEPKRLEDVVLDELVAPIFGPVQTDQPEGSAEHHVEQEQDDQELIALPDGGHNQVVVERCTFEKTQPKEQFPPN